MIRAIVATILAAVALTVYALIATGHAAAGMAVLVLFVAGAIGFAAMGVLAMLVCRIIFGKVS